MRYSNLLVALTVASGFLDVAACTVSSKTAGETAAYSQQSAPAASSSAAAVAGGALDKKKQVVGQQAGGQQAGGQQAGGQQAGGQQTGGQQTGGQQAGGQQAGGQQGGQQGKGKAAQGGAGKGGAAQGGAGQGGAAQGGAGQNATADAAGGQAAGQAAGGQAAGAGGGGCLNPKAVQTGSAADGSVGAAAGQAKSLTDANNFINFCVEKSSQKGVLTNGLQVKAGSCNGIPMGDMPAQTSMVSSMLINPAPGQDLQPLTDFNIQVQMNNLEAGTFTNPDSTYYSAPQQLKGGKIVGHTHVTVQDLGGTLTPKVAPDAAKFVFFKGINDAGNGNGLLQAAVKGGLPAGSYRVCTMAAGANHQPVLMPVAQRGAQDDCTKFTVGGGKAGGGGKAAAGGQAAGGQAAGGQGAAAANGTAAAGGQQKQGGQQQKQGGQQQGGQKQGGQKQGGKQRRGRFVARARIV